MKKPNSIIGKVLYNLDLKIFCNIKLFLERRDYSIESLFLIAYTLLQLTLILSIYLLENFVKITVSIFIIVFLFLISMERIIIHAKPKIALEEGKHIESRYYKLKKENEMLREENETLTTSLEKAIEKLK